MFRWNLLLRKVFASSPSLRQATTPRVILAQKTARSAKLNVKPSLEGLEDRLVPSASASTASVDMEVNSPMVSTMAPWVPVLVTLENDLSRIEQAIIQSIAQEMAVAQQQWTHLLGIGTNSTNASTNAVVPEPAGSSGGSNGSSTPSLGPIANQNGGSITDSGSGSSSHTKPRAASNGSFQPFTDSGDTDGSGTLNGSINGNINANPGIAVNLVYGVISGGLSGSFEGNCVHDGGNQFFAGGGTLGDGTNFSLTPGTYSLTVNGTSLTGSFHASGSGSDGDVVQVNGTFSGTVDANGNITSGTYTGTLIVLDPGTVSGQVWLDNNGDGSLDNGEMGFSGRTVNLDSSTGQQLMSTTTDSNGNYLFNAQSLLSQYSSFEVQVVIPDGDEATYQSAESVIDANGFSPVFALAAGEAEFVPAGIRSMNVTTNQDDANGPIQNQITLRDAVETGNNGPPVPAVTFAQGVSGTISLETALDPINTSYDIDGPGSSYLTVQGNGDAANPYSIFTVNAGVTSIISSLTITGGSGSNGGGIDNNGNLALNSDIIKGNTTSGNGGAIYNGNYATTLTGDQILGNTAAAGGGVYNGGGTLTITGGTVIKSNKATDTIGGHGGGIYNNGSGTVTVSGGTVISTNSAAVTGGGVDNLGTFYMTGGQISGNKATPPISGAGGGVDNGGSMRLRIPVVAWSPDQATVLDRRSPTPHPQPRRPSVGFRGPVRRPAHNDCMQCEAKPLYLGRWRRCGQWR